MDADALEGLRLPGDHRYVSIAALVAARGLDVSTTLYGMQTPGIVERNPIAAGVMARFGDVPGLLSLALVTVLVAVVITEVATARYGGSILPAERLRWLGYAPHVSISVLAAANNLVVATAV